MNFTEQIKTTLSAYFVAMREKHLTNARILCDNNVGVAEHPDVMQTIEEELGKAAEYEDKLEMLDKL